MKVLILGGGDSPERDISLRSARSVATAAREAGFKVEERDPIGGLAFLNWTNSTTIVLPILHGHGGEDGIIQAELERKKLAYLGSDQASSVRCFNKWLTRLDLQAAGLPVAKGALVTKETYNQHELAQKPHVLKVIRGGSSIGTLIVRDTDKLPAGQPQELFKLDHQAVLEELIIGTELTVPILDNAALSPIEIIPPPGLEFDYQNKYNGATAELCPPRTLSAATQQHAMELAKKTHTTMKCRHLSRVDMMVDGSGEIYILEINTMPGLTNQSLYPKSAAVSGLSMPGLITKFVEMVKRDFNI